jgi:ribosomal protein L16 Arg81 hydroxylase
MNLSSLLSPVSIEDFILNYFGKKPLYVGGSSCKYEELFDWEAYNHILATNRLSAKIRVFKDGESIPRSQYSSELDVDGLPGVSKLLQSEIVELLRGGATLIVNGFDEVSEPVRRLSHRLERSFQTRVGVNLYSAWQSSRGFNPHWDDHDVIIVQLKGKKQWVVQGESVKYPMYKRVKFDGPTGPPHWTGVLNQGDMLYIPRGWWHVADPIGQETVHLTIGISNPTGVDIIHWLAGGLSGLEIIRKDVPQLMGDEAGQHYWKELIDAIKKTLDHPDTLSSFKRHWSINSTPKTFFSLPFGISDLSIPSSPTSVVVVLPRLFEIEECAVPEHYLCSFSNRSIKLNVATLCVLKALSRNPEIAISELLAMLSSECDRETVFASLSEFEKYGLVGFR